MSDRIDAKAARYLAEGRLIVRQLDEHGGTVQADVRGTGAVYSVGRERSGWFCDCRARSRCAHIAALQLVVALEPREAR